MAKRGQGAIVEDVDGNFFLDFAAGIAVVSTGHCHPDVVRVIQKQAETLIHMSGTDFYYPLLAQLAEKMAQITPGNFPKSVAFGNSGAEAMEAAHEDCPLPHQAPSVHCLSRLVPWTDHGRAFADGQQGGSAARVRPAGARRRARAVCQSLSLPAGPPRAGLRLRLRLLRICIERQLFKTVVPPDEVAAIIVEPIQGEGGYVIPPPGFLDNLRRLCDKYGILLIFDEVQCGMGRTGKMWACDHVGVAPDILVSAKGIASGLPLGVTVARAELMDWGPGAHASTFGGNPVACAAALETIRLLEEKYIANAARVGEYIMGRIVDWPHKHRIVGQVRGRGLMIGIELVKSQETREPNAEARNRVIERAFELGLTGPGLR